MRAAVIGAGLAGLAAAHELQQAAVDVEVFEARDRVGGRVWSIPFAGAVAERGAEFVFADNAALKHAVGRLGLRLVRKGTLYGNREPRGDDPPSPEELAVAVHQIRVASPPGGRTVREALDERGLRPAVAEAIAARVEVSCAHRADDLEASALTEGAAAFGDFDTYSVEGGNQRLAQALAANLDGQIRLIACVQEIRWSEREVRVFSEGTETVVDAAVVAVPASVTGAIAFDPPLPDAKTDALRSVCYGQAAKLFVALRTPVPPSATLSVPDRFWCYTQLGADGEPLRFVTAFAGTREALERLDVGGGEERWLHALAQLRPDLDLDRESALLSTWHEDPWVGGAYSARSVASPLDTRELARSVGALAFAGEHTAGEWHALMEGAIRSGRRAARDLLSR